MKKYQDIDADKAADDILREIGIAPPAGKSKKRANKTIWTDEMVAELKRWYGEGLTPLEIAERMGLDRVAVNNKLNRAGIRKPAAVGKSVITDKPVIMDQPTVMDKPAYASLDGKVSGELNRATTILSYTDILKNVNFSDLTDAESAAVVMQAVYDEADKLFKGLTEIKFELWRMK